MPSIDLLLILVVVAALAFDYINGFHDTANAIATVVSTRVLTPRAAALRERVGRLNLWLAAVTGVAALEAVAIALLWWFR